MSSKKVAEIVVETLEAAGIRHCYGIVGDTLNHVTDAIHRSQIQPSPAWSTAPWPTPCPRRWD
ncbi:thiamine pyrophosphate-binding protein [Pseudomonas aeruginosa]|nr:thiamine pyrophosphate-binding protein [Pseudomonas aeruginosa]